MLHRVWSGRGGTVLATLALVALFSVSGMLGMIYSGIYNVSATGQHTAPVCWALETAMLRAVRHGSARESGELATRLQDVRSVSRNCGIQASRESPVTSRASRHSPV